MFINHFTLNKSVASDLEGHAFLFRQTGSELLSTSKGSAFGDIFTFNPPFALHVIIERAFNEEYLEKLLERTFLIIGRENYHTILGKKILFLSYTDAQNKLAIKFVSRLISLLGFKVRLTQVPYDFSGKFISSPNVSVETTAEEIAMHFHQFADKMLKQNTLIDPRYFYCIITEYPISHSSLNQIITSELQNASDILSILKEASHQIGLLTEKLSHSEKEKVSYLNAINFLKKEIKHHFKEREDSNRNAQKLELVAVFQQSQRIEELKAKYRREYESLPYLYKKVGVLLKLLFGKIEFGYYLNKRQRQDFIDLLRTLPEERQIELWYYYEYEILPGWYKKFGKQFRK